MLNFIILSNTNLDLICDYFILIIAFYARFNIFPAKLIIKMHNHLLKILNFIILKMTL